ncbi:MAG TPA: hypothetical protein VK797_09775 [Tepidisphaeraceae bacterium]|nr:hypothetical protein [Tepidisphaeraceae bacterium]
MNSQDSHDGAVERGVQLAAAVFWRRAVGAARFVRRSLFGRLSAAERDTLILDVAALMKMGRLGEADRKLNACTGGLTGDAGFINLCGAVCERRGELETAVGFYEIATSVDGDYGPARRNLRRLREQRRVAPSVREIALGDGEVRHTRHLNGAVRVPRAA